jgi:hypothetical protein
MVILAKRTEITQDKMGSVERLWEKGDFTCIARKDIFRKVRQFIDSLIQHRKSINTSIILSPHTPDFYKHEQTISEKK